MIDLREMYKAETGKDTKYETEDRYGNESYCWEEYYVEWLEEKIMSLTEKLETSPITVESEVNYVVHYKWQEGAELFFNREIIKDFAIKDEDALTKLENRLLTVLSNCGMEEEQLATVQITGISQL